MLKIIEDTLLELQLTQATDKLHYNINIGTGLALSISVFRDNLDFFQVKISEVDDLANEYDAQVRAWNQYRDLVPRPLARCISKGWYIIVMQGVHHTVFPQNLEDHGGLSFFLSAPIQNNLLRYFQICGQHRTDVNQTESHHIFFDKLEQHFSSTEYSKIASYWIKFGRLQGADTFPYLAQHGDFVRNNLVLSGGKIKIFDWEDFGKFQFPGLDICTLLLSLSSSAETFCHLLNPDSTIGHRIEPFICQSSIFCCLDTNTFKRLVPLYLLIFLFIKLGYGKSAQERIGNYLVHIHNQHFSNPPT